MITIYGTPHCNMCKMMKSKMQAKNLNFTYIEDEEKSMEASNISGLMSAPIIKIEDKYYSAIDASKVLGL